MAVLTEARVVIHAEHCKACGLCIIACPKKVLEAAEEFNHMGYHPTRYKGEGCIGCGICYYTCPEPMAITIFKKGCEIEE